MRLRRLLLRAAMLAGATGLLLGALALTRPWFRNWGATAEEIHRVLPGDEIVSVARSQSTRAITIDAPADRVWAWLAQTGQDRGGFHSFELLEDMVGAEMENLPYLDPALQQWKLGDKLWMAPPAQVRRRRPRGVDGPATGPGAGVRDPPDSGLL